MISRVYVIAPVLTTVMLAPAFVCSPAHTET